MRDKTKISQNALVNATFFSRWAKPNITEMCVVGKEVVAAAAGCHVVFYNIESGARTRYTANGKQKGDGVTCIAGHRLLPFVAFAENCLYPRILVFFYPALDTPVTVLKGKPKMSTNLGGCAVHVQ